LFLLGQGAGLPTEEKPPHVLGGLNVKDLTTSELLVISHNCDDTIHGSSVVPVCILNAAVRAGSLGLIVGIQHGVKAAIEREYTGMLEDQGELAAIRRQNHIRSPMPGRVERVIAHHSVVIGVVIDPSHGLADTNGDGEGGEPIFVGHNNLHSRNATLGGVLAIGV